MSEEVASRVASVLVGELFPGQRVRIGGAWIGSNRGDEAVVEEFAYHSYVDGKPCYRLNPRLVGVDVDDDVWHIDFLEPID